MSTLTLPVQPALLAPSRPEDAGAPPVRLRSAPGARPRRPLPSGRSRRARAGGAAPHLAVQPLRAVRRPNAGPAGLRLTARGRLVLTVTAIGVLLALLALAGRASAGAAPNPATTPRVTQVTVAPGETLWQIAGRVAPSADRRDTVDRLMELNGLRGATVTSGQSLAVPTG